MEEKKKIDWKLVAILIMAFLLIVCFVQIDSVKGENDELRNDIAMYRNEVSNLRADIAAIYSNVDEQLKKEASLFSGVNYSYDELNAESKTVKLNLSVIPKLLTDNMKVSASLSGNIVELTKNGNAFEGTLEAGLFIDQAQSPFITIETASGQQTEFLENINVANLFKQFLPILNSNMSGSNTHSGGKLNTNMNLIIDYKPANEGISFTSYTIVELVDGVEIGRENITEAVKNSVGNHYTKEYKKSITLSQDQRYEVYVIAEDSLGYIHKTRAYTWMKDSFDAHPETYIGDESIYDKDGNMLYGVKYIEVH